MVMLIAFLSMVDKESGLALLRRVVLASFPPSGDHSFVTLKRRFSCSSDERCKHSTAVRQGTCTRRNLTLISSNQCFQGRNQKKLWLQRCPWLNFLPRYLVLLNFPPPKKRTKTKTCGKFPYWPHTLATAWYSLIRRTNVSIGKKKKDTLDKNDVNNWWNHIFLEQICSCLWWSSKLFTLILTTIFYHKILIHYANKKVELTNLWNEYKTKSQCGAEDDKHSSNSERCI